jgi:hypothetical protein
MKTLLNGRDRREVLDRPDKLHSHAQPRWGKMSAHQMICHLSDALRSALSEKYISPSTSLLKRVILKPLALWLPLPWPHGFKTRPEMDQQRDGTRPVDFESDLEELHILFERFCTREGEFAPRGPARNRPWCPVEHRAIDWAARSPFAGEFEVVIMIAGATEEMHGSDRVS